MDKHLRLLEMMPSEARPEGLRYTGIWGWTSYGLPIESSHALALIEHAGMLWLMGQGYALFDLNGYLDNTIKRTRDVYSLARRDGFDQNYGNTLIDALLAAAEAALAGGETQQ